MFALFGSAAYQHPKLGVLKRSWGRWRGKIDLGSETVDLVLSGDFQQPDSAAAADACALLGSLDEWRVIAKSELSGHYQTQLENYGRRTADFRARTPPPLKIAERDLRSHVTFLFIAVIPRFGEMTTQLGYKTEWAPKQILTVNFVNGKFVELNDNAECP